MAKKEEILKAAILKELKSSKNGLAQSELKSILQGLGFELKDSEVSKMTDELEKEASVYIRRVGSSRLILLNHRLLHHSFEKSIQSKKFKDKIYKIFLVENNFSKSFVISEIKFDSLLNSYQNKGSVIVDFEDMQNILDSFVELNNLIKIDKKDSEVLK